MAQKTVKLNQAGADKLPDNKPVVYKIKTAGGGTNYVGIAKRGRVRERIQEHLAEERIPGANIQVEQMPSIGAARQKEKNIIARSNPKYNQQG